MTSDPAHRLAEQLAASLTGQPAQLLHHCPACGASDHGQPFADSAGRRVAVSLSRVPGLIAAAADPSGHVGIDVEPAIAAAFDGFAGVALHPDEPVPADAEQATRLWARKEAVLKALGTGLRTDPRRLLLTASDRPPAVLAWPDPRSVDIVDLRDLTAPPGYVAALAVIGGSGAAYTQVSIRPATSASV